MSSDGYPKSGAPSAEYLARQLLLVATEAEGRGLVDEGFELLDAVNAKLRRVHVIDADGPIPPD